MVLKWIACLVASGGSSNCFAHKVEHGVHSTNECTSTAMCQAASGFTPKGVLNHCALSRAHNLLNSVPSNVLGREWLALTKCWDLGWALRVMVEVEEQDALGLQQLSLKLISTRVITKYGKLHYSTLIRVVESCTMVLIQQVMPMSVMPMHTHVSHAHAYACQSRPCIRMSVTLLALFM